MEPADLVEAGEGSKGNEPDINTVTLTKWYSIVPPGVKSMSQTIMQNTGVPVGMWMWGRVHVKFWQPP